MSGVVFAAIERELARWEWRERLAQRPEIDLGVEAATLLAAERAVCRGASGLGVVVQHVLIG